MRSLAGAVAALAALARGRGALAQQGFVPIGGVCYHGGQCLDEGALGPVSCDDNGFAYDGDLNCCRYEGFCGVDEHCCGGNICVQGRCVGPSGDGYFRSPGDECWSEDQCRAASGGTLYCAENGFDYDGPLNCCAGDGDRCAFDEHCCGLANCIDGFCGYYGLGPGVGLPLGAGCTNTFECNGGGYGVECRGVCCLSNGQGCGTNSDCCGSDFCEYRNYRQGSVCVQSYGGPCLSDNGCTGALACIAGYCQ